MNESQSSPPPHLSPKSSSSTTSSSSTIVFTSPWCMRTVVLSDVEKEIFGFHNTTLNKQDFFHSTQYSSNVYYLQALIKELFCLTVNPPSPPLETLRHVLGNLIPESCGGLKDWIPGVEFSSGNEMKQYHVIDVRMKPCVTITKEICVFDTNATKSLFFHHTKFDTDLGYLQGVVRRFANISNKIPKSDFATFANIIPMDLGGCVHWVDNTTVMTNESPMSSPIPPVPSIYLPPSPSPLSLKRSLPLESLPPSLPLSTTTTTTTGEREVIKKAKPSPLPLLVETAIKTPHKTPNPKTFLKVQFGDDENDVGTMEFELFADIVPKTVENFRSLCIGTSEGLCYKNTTFFRIIKGFMCQGGDVMMKNGKGGRSIYGPMFKDENFKAGKHERYTLSMANTGPNTNSSQFFICLDKAPWLDGKNVAFGKLIKGEQVLDRIGTQGEGQGGKVKQIIKVVDCGEVK